MRNGLRILAAMVGITAIVVWLGTGAHTGWTKTQVTEMEIDPITELEYPVKEDRFVAGLEVLGGGVLLALALFAGSFVFKKKNPTTERNPTP